MKYFPPWRGVFNGIINYLNVHHYDELDSYINAIGSSTAYPWGVASKTIDFRITNFTIQANNWASNNLKNSSLTISFRRHKVLATHYSILSPNNSGNYPQNWIIEGMFNDDQWHLIDTVKKSTYLKGRLLSHTYKFDAQSIFRSFRITQNENNSGNNSYFHITRFELFGSISDIDERECFIPYKCTKNCVKHSHSMFILSYLFVHSA